jgi:hypothetical protein
MSSNRPFAVSPELTGIAIAAKVPGMIADQVLSPIPVTSELYKWTEYALDQGLTVPDTKVGRTSAVKRVEFGGTEREGGVDDHALESPVPRTDQQAYAAGNAAVNPEEVATEMTSQLVTLARELRTVGVVYNAANYLPAQVTTYAADMGWYDPDGDPLEEIETAKQAMAVDPNTLTLGPDGWAALRSHPKMVKAARPASAAGDGRLTLDEVRDLLEIETINVGKAFFNFAKPGQNPQLRRAWANHASLTYVERVLKNTKVFTFGSTFRLTDKKTWTRFDADAGIDGSDIVRVGERLKEQVVAKAAGWLFLNAGTAP